MAASQGSEGLSKNLEGNHFSPLLAASNLIATHRAIADLQTVDKEKGSGIDEHH